MCLKRQCGLRTLAFFTVYLTAHSCFCQLGGTGQPMGPRPAMGVTAPRAMPPYKYATAIRNTQPQVVQPITLQQVISAVNQTQIHSQSHVYSYINAL